jgi:hypothetical protein
MKYLVTGGCGFIGSHIDRIVALLKSRLPVAPQPQLTIVAPTSDCFTTGLLFRRF